MTTHDKVTILDGGMGRQLERIGAPFRLPEWSALALIEAPHLVQKAHEQFIESGAEIVTTNTYAIKPHQIGAERFEAEGLLLADRAGRVARAAADQAGRPVRVAGSLPPVFESYRPELFDAAGAPEILGVLVEGLAPHVDLWLIETQSSTVEALAAIAAIADHPKPIWVSYTLKDEAGRTGPPELRSGETVATGVTKAVEAGAVSILFNCSQPEVMEAAIREARETLDANGRSDVSLGVYANAFAAEAESDEPYAGISDIRADVTPARYLVWATRWIDAGASIVGGCCGIGPEHIAEIRHHLDPARPETRAG
ncbi:homocysteine S-methyltransferase family protein [Kaistia terrae]|uniref:Homocysteine S-methyltransferase family protein n=1 Tax=Kaistia terrae TaxID=537017 RepID=A0ABW0PSK9_9HYPH|nr:homocysteine S-methyltransferase family protein [Kaistia terrae]MCX5577453.1 homocysteine S-methyltransferase family protein [Kaistia terrae]